MEIVEPEGTRRSETATEEPMPEVKEAFEEIEVDAPLVGIIMGSANDKEKMQPAGAALQDKGIRYEVRVMSAHRDPEKVREYCHAARMRGLQGDHRRRGDVGCAAGRRGGPYRPAGARRPAHRQEPRGARRAPVRRPDAPRSARWLRCNRRRQERRAAGRTHNQFVIERYTRARDGRGMDGRAPNGGLAPSRAGRDGGLGRRGRRSLRRGHGLQRARLVHGRGSRGARARDGPRRRGLRGRGGRVDRPRGPLDPLRAHVLRRPRHGARASAPRCRRKDPRRSARATATR